MNNINITNNSLIITCEHASNAIPQDWQYLFDTKIAQNDLQTHLGIDLGAKNATEYIADALSAPYFLADYSRLLIELNRSIDSKTLFSKYSRLLSDSDKKKIIDNIYYPYRNKIEDRINKEINLNHRVIHLSIHSFTPVLNNKTRSTDMGLLYDPRRSLEKKLCADIKNKHNLCVSKYKLKLNYPYRGYTDGLTTYLRTRFSHENYIGIEIEINQKYSVNNKFPVTLLDHIINLIKSTC